MSNLSDLLGGGGAPLSQVFTAGGTWTRPAGVDLVYITAIGGGGGGGKGGSASPFAGGDGGDSGGYCQRLPVAVSADVTVTIGAGGAGSTSISLRAGSGGETLFGTALTLTGGRGGFRQVDSFAASLLLGKFQAAGGFGGWIDRNTREPYGNGQAGEGLIFPGGAFGTGATNRAGGGGGGGLRGPGGDGGNPPVAGGANTGAGGGGSNGLNATTADGADGGSGYLMVEWFE